MPSVKTPPNPEKQEAETPPPAPKRNPTIDLIAAAQKELQEATLVLMGTKTNGTVDAVINTASNIIPMAKEATTATPLFTNNVISVAKAPSTMPGGGLIKISGTDINKFPETDQFLEMRLLTIRLKATELQKELDPGAVRIEVMFADRDKSSRRISPASPRGTSTALTIPGMWRATEQKTVMASYVVSTPPTRTERMAQYYGFIIRVYYREILQDELSQPNDLLKDESFAPPDETQQPTAP